MEIIDDLPEELGGELGEKWGAFCAAAEAAGISLPNDSVFEDVLKKVFVFSDFVSRNCTLEPGIVDSLATSGDLRKSYARNEYMDRLEEPLAEASGETDLGRILRRFRNREMIRIAWRDMAGWADLEETMADLSYLAEACVDRSFSLLYGWHRDKFGTPIGSNGFPTNIVVLGMGKLGAAELNFSSDIDLIFAFPEAGSTIDGPRSVSNEEFFVGLSRRFLKVFSATGPHGLLYRVDTRLRPFGENGPLAMSFNAMEDYYQRQGREWERYAMIKAKVVAGDREAGGELMERLRPFIYRRYLDYGVYESLREMKQKIGLEVERKGLEGNIKIGFGGIREVEFFGQIFQLARGGVELHLQERSILKVLDTLVEEGYIPQNVRDELTRAYFFLRRTENRLQEYSDQQIHVLPSDDIPRLRLAASLGFGDWRSYLEEFETHTGKVHSHFKELLVNKDQEEAGDGSIDDELYAVWQGLAERDRMVETLTAAGYTEVDEISGLLEYLRNDSATQSLSPKGRGWLDKLMPDVLKKVGLSEQPEVALKRIVDLVRTIEQRTVYLSLLLENPQALTHLVKLANASPWIISFLSRHPLLLDELLDPRTLYSPPDKEDLEKSLHRRLEQLPEDDVERQLEELTVFKNVNVLHVAAADISGAFQLMKVSDYLSDTAETILSEILDLSWNQLDKRYGNPVSALGGEPCQRGFAIVAYGKLGGLELGYGSDLDLVFLHAGLEEETDGQDGIDSPQFYIRLGQRIVHLLTTHTRAGRLYEIDMRLRPSGNSGILVSNIEAFREYQGQEAWTWEHQALIRARPICGDGNILEYFKKIKKEILQQPRDKETLREEIRSMRARMRKEHGQTEPGLFDIKRGRGGIVDIEFLVQYLVLLHAHENDEFARWTDNVRLIGTLNKTRILENETANLLRGAYLNYRSQVHKLSLQEKSAVVALDHFGDLPEKVGKVWDDFLEE
ncbi:MAG: bifunctional [glutamate--ammonia ligase]-adenylyl-L-tyrosine phosphorylase/[glutamate--ammonia-ligase] adenylyltransferase [Proteobacteria bacterium]|nr:bifunctional [glutamate--ammonia ligase]-adenylyl-L-tyrosine phosphorylase/[glutamate--ammonia-ligase] adenylyltransferase [Pseudomonadota bacterium]